VITVTTAAAEEIRRSAEAAGTPDDPLRIAARRVEDGSIEYAVGFDEVGETDVRIAASSDVTVIIDGTSVELLDGATVDYVELGPGQFELVFLNPNDPHFVPPRKEQRSKKKSER